MSSLSTALTRASLIGSAALIALGVFASGSALARQGDDGEGRPLFRSEQRHERPQADRRDDRRDHWRAERRDERHAERRDERRAERRAERRDERRAEFRRDQRRHWRNDRRHGPRVGVVVPLLPTPYREIRHHRRSYFYAGGFWYDPWGSSFIRIAAPIGVVISSLPVGHASVTLGGNLYYRYDDAWYRPHDRGYVVVAPPAEASDAAAQDDDTLFAYPGAGQSETQQADDRFHCHEWAARQSGYDPSLISAGGARADELQQRPAYLRAMTACLEGRGYTVR